MKKDNTLRWRYPTYFFIFIAFYVTFKFIVIFFFRAAYAPRFLFDMTPLFLLSGITNLQLIFISFIIVISNAYLHLIVSKKAILISIVLSGLMLSGLGIVITSEDVTTSLIFHYLLFIGLIVAIVLDHKNSLTLTYDYISITPNLNQIPANKKDFQKSTQKKKPLYTKQPTRLLKTKTTIQEPRFSLSSLQSLVLVPFQRRKVKKQNHEDKIQKQHITHSKRKHLSHLKSRKAQLSVSTLQPILESNIVNTQPMLEDTFDIQQKLLEIDEKIERMKSDDNLPMEDLMDGNASLVSSDHQKEGATVIIQDGVIKEIDPFLTEILGYSQEELMDKNFTYIIAKDGLSEVRKYYLERMKGKQSSSYTTYFLTKNNKIIHMNVDIVPTIYQDECAEIAIINKIIK